MQAAGDSALKNGGNEANEAQKTPVLRGGIAEQIICHERKGELNSGEKEYEDEVGEVEEEVGIRALSRCGMLFLR